MPRRIVVAWCALLVLGLLPLALGGTPRASFAQTASLEPSASLRSGLYRLDLGSTYQTGCFDPCLCPILAEVPVRGTLELALIGSDGDFDVFAVSDVSWTVSLGERELRALGSGTYRIGTGLRSEPVQQLELELAIDGEPPQKFDSGLVPARADGSIDVAISMNGMVCFDTVFAIRASRVPLAEIAPYRLADASSFQRGCVGMCDCLAGEPQPVDGRFALVKLPQERAEEALLSRFAVVRLRWRVDIDGEGPEDPVRVRGVGSYELGGEFALRERMLLDLEIGDEPQARFDSGFVSPGARFPRINVEVTNGDPSCFLTVIDILAGPARRPSRLRR